MAFVKNKDLDISRNQIASIDFSGPLTYLYSLRASGNQLQNIIDVDMKAPNLTILDVANNKIESDDDLECLLYLDRIAEVSVEGNPFFSPG